MSDIQERLHHFEEYCKDHDDEYGAEVLHRASKEIEHLQAQNKVLTEQIHDYLARIDKLEKELAEHVKIPMAIANETKAEGIREWIADVKNDNPEGLDCWDIIRWAANYADVLEAKGE